MNINFKTIMDKMKQRQDKIQTYVNANKVPAYVAAVYVDMNAPLTTNKKMLANVGFNVDTVTIDNYKDVIVALEMINVTVMDNSLPEDQVVSSLNNVLNDEINECWGGNDMREYIDLTPQND